MTIPQTEYGFKADINHYVSATALEELTAYLGDVGTAKDYDSSISAIDQMIETLKWHKNNLENDAPAEQCHKDDLSFHENRGS